MDVTGARRLDARRLVSFGSVATAPPVVVVLIVAALVGGVSGGFGSLSGNLLRKIWMMKPKSRMYQ